MLKVTAKDVARVAQVDASTVSRVLNRRSARHRYAPRTEQRIRDAAQRLGYRPSRLAQALRTGKTFCLGLVVADIANPFWAELAARIERRARAEKYRLLICNTEESPRQQREVVAELVEHGVDGLIVAPSGAAGLAEAVAGGLPVVTIDRAVAGLSLPHVGLDDRQAGRLLGEHLAGLGYRAVAVAMPAAETDPSILRRRDGLAESLRVLWEAPPLAEEIQRRLQSSSPAPPAIVGLHNASTLAALEALAGLSVRIPEQMGLAGIDDFAAARLLRPAVTVIAQPLAEMAGEALRILWEWIERPSRPPTAVRLLPPALVRRDSLRSQPQPKGESHELEGRAGHPGQ